MIVEQCQCLVVEVAAQLCLVVMVTVPVSGNQDDSFSVPIVMVTAPVSGRQGNETVCLAVVAGM